MSLHYPFSRPEHGQPMTIRHGLHLLRMPLPFALDHINLWLLDDGEAWSLVDTGAATDACRDLWNALSDRLGQPGPREILVTHFHPDHFGLAGWFQARTGATLYMSAGEAGMARTVWEADDQQHVRRILGLYEQHGLPPEFIEPLLKRGNGYRRLVAELPVETRQVVAGEMLHLGGRDWQLIGTNGHSPEHMCPYSARDGVLISGDQLLPTISSNVSVGPHGPEDNPLVDFLDSLMRLRELPTDTLVLPSHGLPFTGLRERVDALHAHHRERLDALLDACRTPSCAGDVLPVLFRRELDGHTVFFAMGEAVAHLHYLWRAGELAREQDGDGIYRFAIA